MRLLILAILTILGAALVVSSGVIGDWESGAIASIYLELGAALLLVPILFWAERQIENRIEEVREHVRENVRGLSAPGEPIRLSDPWEDAHAHLERYWHLRTSSTVNIRLGSQDVWLGFATTRQYNPMARCLFSPIYIYFHDPSASAVDSRFDAIYEWRSGVSLSAALDAVLDTARHQTDCPVDLTLNKKQVLADLRLATAL